jgi:hypothetical protein
VTALLLDFPWDLTEVIGPDPDKAIVLREFDNLARETGFTPIPFFEQREYAGVMNGLSMKSAGNNVRRALFQFLPHLLRDSEGRCEAVPSPEPSALRTSWKRALRDGLTDASDWRKPQLVVPQQRSREWPDGGEVNIMCLPCDGQLETGPHPRTLVILERYRSHVHASSDHDPWDLRRVHPATAAPRQYPCFLPKPPSCERIPVNELGNVLAAARAKGCRLDGRYYFLPPADWKLERVSKDSWRDGGTFPREQSRERSQVGYVDCEGNNWVWDMQKRHWDVQRGGRDYVSITHTGVQLL